MRTIRFKEIIKICPFCNQEVRALGRQEVKTKRGTIILLHSWCYEDNTRRQLELRKERENDRI